MKTLSLTTCNRKDNLMKLLDSLESQTVSLKDYKLVIHMEPGFHEVEEVCKSIDFVDTEIVINEKILGVKQNTFNVITHAFDYSTFNIYLEDDLILSPDALALAEWFSGLSNINEYGMLCLTNLSAGIDFEAVERIEGATCWGFAMNKFQFETFAKYVWMDTKAMWDYNVGWHITELGFKNLVPSVSRCTNSGDMGVHIRPGMLAELQKNQTFNKTPAKFNYYLKI